MPDVEYEKVDERKLELRATTPSTIEAALTPGAYSVTVREEGVDVVVSMTAGDAVFETREPVNRHGSHLIHLEVPATTAAKIAVKIDERGTQIGNAALEIRRWHRPLDATPSKHELGDQAFAQAIRAVANGSSAEPTSVINELERARAHYDAARSLRGVALTHYAMASIQYVELSAWLDAEEHAAFAAAAFEGATDPLAAARARVLLAAARLERANEISSLQDKSARDALLQSADETLSLSITRLRTGKQHADQADATNIRGIGRWYARDFDAARSYFVEARAAAEALDDASLKTKVLGNLAWLDFLSGRPQDAAAEYRELLGSVNPEHESHTYTAITGNYALVLAALGDFDGAIRLHANALERATATNDEQTRMQQLVAIAALSLKRGDAQRALSVARSALAMPDGLKDRSQYNSALRVAGQASLNVADDAAAREYFLQLLDRSIGERETALARVLLAQSLRKVGRPREAATQLEQALQENDPWIQAQALTERAHISLAGGDATSAARDLDTVDKAYVQLGLDAPRIEVGALLARARSQLGMHDGALQAADNAIKLVHSIRGRSADADVRASFLAAQYAPFEAKIDLLLERSRKQPGARQDAWAAIATAEQARAQTLNDLRAKRMSQDETDDRVVARARDTLIAQRLLLERRLQRSHANDPAVREIRRDIAEAATRLAALSAGRNEGSSHGNAPANAPADQAQLPNYQQLLAALPASVAVAYFFVGDEQTHYWLMQGAATAHYALPGRRQMDVEVQRFLDQGTAPLTKSARFGPMSDALRTIADTLAATNATRIVVLADGPLNSLPFAALSIATDKGQTFLVERAAVVYVPSLTAAATKRTPSPRLARSQIAVVSDPVYASDDVRLAEAGPAPSRLRSDLNDDLTRLPFSSAEAREIKRLYSQSPVIDLAGFRATTAAVSELPFADLRVLHFAAHAIARDDDPLLSALYLTAYDHRRAPLENRAITAESVLRLRMRADLVVLSGCSTAGGAPIAGEGMLGLTHSFLANGSQSVVASLWPVDDAETARLMARFYAEIRAGLSPEIALAAAQRKSLATGSDAASIRNWFSFVVRSTDLIGMDSTNRGVNQ